MLARQPTDVSVSPDGKRVALAVTDGVLGANADGFHVRLLAFER